MNLLAESFFLPWMLYMDIQCPTCGEPTIVMQTENGLVFCQHCVAFLDPEDWLPALAMVSQ